MALCDHTINEPRHGMLSASSLSRSVKKEVLKPALSGLATGKAFRTGCADTHKLKKRIKNKKLNERIIMCMVKVNDKYVKIVLFLHALSPEITKTFTCSVFEELAEMGRVIKS